jgi:hypothetical protein
MPQLRSEFGAQLFGDFRVLQHQRALYVAVAVQARGKNEVALEESRVLTKDFQDFVVGHGFLRKSKFEIRNSEKCRCIPLEQSFGFRISVFYSPGRQSANDNEDPKPELPIFDCRNSKIETRNSIGKNRHDPFDFRVSIFEFRSSAPTIDNRQ